MQQELASSGLTHEEILAKTMLMQKAMAGDNSPAFMHKNLQNAIKAADLEPAELAKVRQKEKNPQVLKRLLLSVFLGFVYREGDRCHRSLC